MEEYFTIPTEGKYIFCKLYRKNVAKPERVILFGHGFGGHKDNNAAARLAKAVIRQKEGVNFITFDWPGHKDSSQDEITLSKCDDYLDSICTYIHQEMGIPQIDVNATSFGGYLILRYIYTRGDAFGKISLRCPAVRMFDVLKDRIMTEENRDKINKGEDAMVGFDRKVKVTSDFFYDLMEEDITKWDYSFIADRIQILHGTEDEIASFDSSRAFAISNKMQFIPIAGADHRFSDSEKMNEAINIMMDFLL